jgi:hypothetical protein
MTLSRFRGLQVVNDYGLADIAQSYKGVIGLQGTASAHPVLKESRVN